MAENVKNWIGLIEIGSQKVRENCARKFQPQSASIFGGGFGFALAKQTIYIW